MKIYKKIFIVVLAVSMILSIVGCGEIKKAETAVNGMFVAFKNLDFDKAQKYVNVEDITNADNANENTTIVMQTVFDNLEYEIISSEKIDDNNVIVKTKIIAIDMKPVMGEFFTKAMEYAFSNAFSTPQPTEEETNKKMEEILIECASKPDLATISKEIDIKVSKNDEDEWKIRADEVFANVILGGLMDIASNIENSFNIEK